MSLSRLLVQLTSAFFITNSRQRVDPPKTNTPVFSRAFKRSQLTNRIMVFWQKPLIVNTKGRNFPRRLAEFFSHKVPTHSIFLPSNLAAQHCLPLLLLFILFWAFFACYLALWSSCLGLPPQRRIALYLLFELFIKERGRQERNCSFVVLLVSPCNVLLPNTASRQDLSADTFGAQGCKTCLFSLRKNK